MDDYESFLEENGVTYHKSEYLVNRSDWEYLDGGPMTGTNTVYDVIGDAVGAHTVFSTIRMPKLDLSVDDDLEFTYEDLGLLQMHLDISHEHYSLRKLLGDCVAFVRGREASDVSKV